MVRYLFLGVLLVTTAVQPVAVHAADRVVTLPKGHMFAATVRLGAPTGGPSVREAVPDDLAGTIFKEKYDADPVNGWFDRTYRASLKKNGLLARKPEGARFELTAEVKAMEITPLVTGSHHKSVVVYRLHEIASGRQLWEQTQTLDVDIARGVRFGKIGAALGESLGGALTGQSPAVTSATIAASNGQVRPFDVRIDVYEGIMRGFGQMAEKTVAELAALQLPAS